MVQVVVSLRTIDLREAELQSVSGEDVKELSPNFGDGLRVQAAAISAERLTRSDTAILEGPRAGWPARAVPAYHHRGPAGTHPDLLSPPRNPIRATQISNTVPLERRALCWQPRQTAQ